MTAKELLRERIEELSERIDEISEDEAANVLWRLEDAFDPAPPSPEEIEHIKRGIADLDAGRSVPHGEALRRLGISR